MPHHRALTRRALGPVQQPSPSLLTATCDASSGISLGCQASPSQGNVGADVQKGRGARTPPPGTAVWPVAGHYSPARETLLTHSVLLHPWGSLDLESGSLAVMAWSNRGYHLNWNLRHWGVFHLVTAQLCMLNGSSGYAWFHHLGTPMCRCKPAAVFLLKFLCVLPNGENKLLWGK